MQHCWRLTYTHPLTDEWMMFESPAPREIAMAYAWVEYKRGRQGFKEIKAFRQVKRGKNKGLLEVILLNGKKRIVKKVHAVP